MVREGRSPAKQNLGPGRAKLARRPSLREKLMGNGKVDGAATRRRGAAKNAGILKDQVLKNDSGVRKELRDAWLNLDMHLNWEGTLETGDPSRDRPPRQLAPVLETLEYSMVGPIPDSEETATGADGIICERDLRGKLIAPPVKEFKGDYSGKSLFRSTSATGNPSPSVPNAIPEPSTEGPPVPNATPEPNTEGNPSQPVPNAMPEPNSEGNPSPPLPNALTEPNADAMARLGLTTGTPAPPETQPPDLLL